MKGRLTPEVMEKMIMFLDEQGAGDESGYTEGGEEPAALAVSVEKPVDGEDGKMCPHCGKPC